MEAAHAAHRRGLERLERGDDDLGEDDKDDDDDDDDAGAEEGQENDEAHAWGSRRDYAIDDAMDIDAPSSDSYYRDRLRSTLSSPHDRDPPYLAPPPPLLLPPPPPPPPSLSRRERRRLQREDELRRTALQRMASVAERMDTAMEAVPFSRDAEMLRLRAMVALYIADLNVPPSIGDGEARGSRKGRVKERRRARDLLAKIKEGGGKLQEHDEELLRSLQADEEDEEEEEDGEEQENPSHKSATAALPLFSSMEF
ncbi:hypothetical protein VTJ83DRAFT_4769 [Remersonia thermophila]|uniref:Uncharacterized protein n=1 Tax=Remersonia thermophila TaxID=72144 RepID=A0ABR4DB42_9PEZI